VHVNLAARVLAYALTLAIPIAGIGASFLVGWCISRVVLSVTRNDGAAYLSFFVGMVVTGAAFIYWVWVPLRPAIKRLGARDPR
jgi:F0F1-type ATP synthase membrane subunit c/vacuolar-type H+-ATPase subunit K